jgi:hypothetical protein
MKSIDILPITIFENYMEVPDSLIEGIKNDSKDINKCDTPHDWDGGAFSSFNYVSDLLYRTEQNKQLIDNVIEIVKTRPEYLSFGDDFIYEYHLWWNYYTNWQYQEYHSHGNNLISGIWYLTDSKAHTVFCERGLKHKVAAEKGKLIFFPSSLAHYVEPSNDERMTVSFNFQLSKTRPKMA